MNAPYTDTVTQPCIVLIAAADVLPALKKQTGETAGELLAFADTDALRALEVITKRRPKTIALERLFAATPRGAALISRIKADPALASAEIRVISTDSDYGRVAARKNNDGSPGSAAAVAPAPAPAAAQPLDQRGTRRAQRFRIAGKIDVIVDGNPAALVDLSTVGAQIVSGSILKPNQRVRMSLGDENGTIRFNASVAWASFEIAPKSGPRYRAGVEFMDVDGSTVGALLKRHAQPR